MASCRFNLFDDHRFVGARNLGVAILLGVSLIWLWLPGRIVESAAEGSSAPDSFVLGVHRVCPAGPPTCDYRTIQAAVDAAGPEDLIKVAAGVYKDVNAYGGLSQAIYISKSLTIRGGYDTDFKRLLDVTDCQTVVDAGRRGRALYITGDISPTIENLCLAGGDAKELGGGQWGYDVGGGVYIDKSTATISNSRIFSNTAQDGSGIFLYESDAVLNGNTVVSNITVKFGSGGGVYLYKSNATIRENSILSNVAHTDGGGVFLYESTAVLTGNIISFNTISQNHGGGIRLYYSTGTELYENIVSHNTARYGGGLSLWKSEMITLGKNIITGNMALSAGGILLYGSDGLLEGNTIRDNLAYWHGSGLVAAYSEFTLRGNTVTTNHADLDGGGVFLEASQITLDKNTITANTADRGGGMLIYTTTATLTNNLIADNQANSAGSGVSIWAGRVDFVHNTFANNRGAGGGVYVTSYRTSLGKIWPSAVALTNTILSGHRTGITVTAGNAAIMANTLWFDNDQDWAGDLAHGDDYTGAPGFVAPECGDYHLRTTSSALDHARPTSVEDDIDGEGRPTGAAADLGADELHPRPALRARKRASADVIAAGQRLTYTLYVTNTGSMALHALITDTLSQHIQRGATSGGSVILPGGTLVWSPVIEVEESWSQTLGVTVSQDYKGTLENRLEVETQEGVAQSTINTVIVIRPRIYLPLILREVGF